MDFGRSDFMCAFFSFSSCSYVDEFDGLICEIACNSFVCCRTDCQRQLKRRIEKVKRFFLTSLF